MGSVVLISIFAVAGALLRWKLQDLFSFDAASSWPWMTLIINLVGSLLMGFFLPLMNISWVPMVTIGFLGSFTTFSTFSGESLLLINQERWTAVGSYMLASVFGGIVCALIGWKISKLYF